MILSAFFCRDQKISNESISMTNSSWKDFRTTAPMKFFMGNRFPIDLLVLGHSVHRFGELEVSKDSKDILESDRTGAGCSKWLSETVNPALEFEILHEKINMFRVFAASDISKSTHKVPERF